MNKRAEAVPLRLPVRKDGTQLGLVRKTQLPPESVGQQAVGDVVREQVGMLEQVVADVARAVDWLASILAGRVDGQTVRVGLSRFTDRIEGLERIAKGIDLGMTVRAGLDRSVFLQLLSDGLGSADIGL